MMKNKKNQLSIYIFDHDRLVHYGFKSIIEKEKGLMVCGETTDFKKAIKDIELLKPHIVIVEPFSDYGNSIEIIKNIKLLFPEIPVLVLSSYDEAIYAEKTIKNGASGYIMKTESTFKIMEAIRSILSGTIYLSNKIKKTGIELRGIFVL